MGRPRPDRHSGVGKGGDDIVFGDATQIVGEVVGELSKVPAKEVTLR